MDVGEFTALFQPEVRSLVDWRRLEQECEVSLELVVSSIELGGLDTVWYVDSRGSLTDWRDQSARRISVSEAAGRKAFPSDESASFIGEVESAFLSGAHARVWGAPCYAAPSGRKVLLDGNHRAVALMRSGVPVRLMLAVASGPADARILPDLLHDGRELTSSRWVREVEAVDTHFRSLDGQRLGRAEGSTEGHAGD